MSIQSNFKSAETLINRMRISFKLRILWPDFQVYDLLASGYSLAEIVHLSSFPPNVITLDLSEPTFQAPLDSKEITHMAITKMKSINQDLQVRQKVYVLLTKRNIAIDQLECKFNHGRYHLMAQVAQLSTRYCLWGAQIVTDQVKVITPRHVAKTKTTWLIDYESQHPIKAIIFYSVERQPIYGKNSHEHSLSKHAIRQTCLRYRQFESVLQSYFSTQPLHNFDNHWLHYSFKNLSLGKQQERSAQEDKPKQEQPRSSVKLSLVKSDSTHQDKKLVKIALQEQGIQLWNHYRKSRHERLCQCLGQLQLLTKNQNIKFLFSYHDNPEKELPEWIDCHKQASQLQKTQTQDICHQYLQHSLILNGPKLFKDSDHLLDTMLNLIGPYLLKTCLTEILTINSGNQIVISDILSIIVKLQDLDSVFTLYHKQQTWNERPLVAEAISQWLHQQKIPSNHDLNLLYSSLSPDLMLVDSSSSTCLEQSSQETKTEVDTDDLRFHFKNDAFCEQSLLSSAKIQVDAQWLTVYLFRKDEYFYCFVELIPSIACEKKQFNTYRVVFKVQLDKRQVRREFVWNFCLPSHSVGHRWKTTSSEPMPLECWIYLRHQVVHQSVMNFFRIRSTELFGFPEDILSEQRKNNRSSMRLSKSRSTFHLQSFKQAIQNMAIDCFFHKSCEQCNTQLESKSIYLLSPIDFYAILLSADFQRQFHCLLALLKYFLLTQSHHQFILSALRINYLQGKNLLNCLESIKESGPFYGALKRIVQTKLKSTLQSGYRSADFLFGSKGRQLGVMTRFCEEDYTLQYYKFLK